MRISSVVKETGHRRAHPGRGEREECNLHDARSFVSYLRMTYDPLFCVSVRRKEWAIHMKIGMYSKLVSYSYSLVLCIRYSYIFGSIVFCAITIVSLLMNERTANVRSALCTMFHVRKKWNEHERDLSRSRRLFLHQEELSPLLSRFLSLDETAR